MVKTLFPTQIYVASLYSSPLKTKREVSELTKEIKQIQKIDDKGRIWSSKNYFGGYTSYGSMDRLDLFSSSFFNLEKYIHKHVAKFSQALHWDVEAEDLILNSLWVNVMPRGAHHSFHIHPLSVISGTFYVQIPRGASLIQFEDPRMSRMMACPPRSAKAPQSERWHYNHEPKAGELVLFESWLRHQVPAQTPDKERISVSFNYSWKNSVS